MNRRTFASGAAALSTVAFVRSRAEAEPIVFKWAHATQVEHPLNLSAVRVKDEVAQRSNGRLQIQLFGNNVLGGDTAMLAQVRSGSIQMYSGYGGIYQNVAPVAGLEAIAFAFHTQEQALAAFDGPLGAFVRADIDRKGGLVTFERPWVNGFRQITTSTHPIVTVADMTGLKIRTPPSPIWTDAFKGLGASPTPINASEMYAALQTHVVDAQENPFVIVLTYRLFEVQRYLSVTNHMWSNFWVVANEAAFGALPPDLQAILRDTVNKYALTNRRETEVLNASLAEKLSRLGMTVNAVDVVPFREKLAAAGFYAKYKQQYGDAAWSLLEASVGPLE